MVHWITTVLKPQGIVVLQRGEGVKMYPKLCYVIYVQPPKAQHMFIHNLRNANLTQINMNPLPFLLYSPLIEFCNQLALGVFQILKSPILTKPGKIHTLKL